MSDKFIHLHGETGFFKLVAVADDEWGHWFTEETYWVSKEITYPANHIMCHFADLTQSKDTKYWRIHVSLSDYDDYGMSYEIPVLADKSNYLQAINQGLSVYNAVHTLITRAEIVRLGFVSW